VPLSSLLDVPSHLWASMAALVVELVLRGLRPHHYVLIRPEWPPLYKSRDSALPMSQALHPSWGRGDMTVEKSLVPYRYHEWKEVPILRSEPLHWHSASGTPYHQALASAGAMADSVRGPQGPRSSCTWGMSHASRSALIVSLQQTGHSGNSS
jgi:hypothetical protein